MKLETTKLLKKVCMKLRYYLATENRLVLETVYKRLEAEEARKLLKGGPNNNVV